MRLQVHSDNIGHLPNEQGVFGNLNGFATIGIERESPPDPADGSPAQAASFGHPADAPLPCPHGSDSSARLSTRSTSTFRTVRGRARPGLLQQVLAAIHWELELPATDSARVTPDTTTTRSLALSKHLRNMRIRKASAWVV